MRINRRSFIKRLYRIAGASAIGSTLSGCERAASSQQTLFLSASADHLGEFHIGAYNLSGDFIVDIPVVERAHGMTLNPIEPDKILFFSRRPGRFCIN